MSTTIPTSPVLIAGSWIFCASLVNAVRELTFSSADDADSPLSADSAPSPILFIVVSTAVAMVTVGAVLAMCASCFDLKPRQPTSAPPPRTQNHNTAIPVNPPNRFQTQPTSLTAPVSGQGRERAGSPLTPHRVDTRPSKITNPVKHPSAHPIRRVSQSHPDQHVTPTKTPHHVTPVAPPSHVKPSPNGTPLVEHQDSTPLSSHLSIPAPNTTPSLKSPASAPATGKLLRLEEETVEGVVALLDQVRNLMGGRFHRQYSMSVDSEPRVCDYSVSVQASFSFGRDVDILFFPQAKFFSKQKTIFTNRQLAQFRAETREVNEVISQRTHKDPASGYTVELPLHIITEHSEPLKDVLMGTEGTKRSVHLYAVSLDISEQLIQLHKKHIVQRGIAKSNVVHVTESQKKWTLREYSGFSVHNKPATAMPNASLIWTLPPEAAIAHQKDNAQQVTADTAMDVWQLGVLLYEILSDKRYWPVEYTEEDVLECLISPNQILPHESHSHLDEIGTHSGLARTKLLLTRMLSRDPSKRPAAADVERELKTEFENHTIGGATTMWHSCATVQF